MSVNYHAAEHSSKVDFQKMFIEASRILKEVYEQSHKSEEESYYQDKLIGKIQILIEDFNKDKEND